MLLYICTYDIFDRWVYRTCAWLTQSVWVLCLWAVDPSNNYKQNAFIFQSLACARTEAYACIVHLWTPRNDKSCSSYGGIFGGVYYFISTLPMRTDDRMYLLVRRLYIHCIISVSPLVSTFLVAILTSVFLGCYSVVMLKIVQYEGKKASVSSLSMDSLAFLGVPLETKLIGTNKLNNVNTLRAKKK